MFSAPATNHSPERRHGKMARQGIIRGFATRWDSGIAFLLVDEDGRSTAVPCEAGQTGRSLRSAFGQEGIMGQEIMFNADDRGVLANFTPLERGCA